MEIKYRTCDHCGIRLDPMKDFEGVELDKYGLVVADLCANCYEEFEQLTRKFVDKMNNKRKEEQTMKSHADHIRSMTDEELAKWHVLVTQRILEMNPMLERPARYEDWLDWMKQEGNPITNG